MRAMHDLLTQDPSNNNIIPFGNPYTPYRIWQTILNSSDKDIIMSKLSPQQRQDVNDIITLLQNTESTIDRNSFRTKLEY
jgi:hypothetical protein